GSVTTAAQRIAEASANVAVMDFRSREVRVLTKERMPDMQWSVVAFSHDGRQIVANRADITGGGSPIWLIDVATGTAQPAITCGRLCAHSKEKDIRVPKYEAEQVVATLQRRGQTVDAKYYPDEGHGFS